MNKSKKNTPLLSRPLKVISYICISMTILCLVLSLFYAYKANTVLAGQLIAKKSLTVITEPLFLIKMMKFGYFQFYFFTVAIVFIGIFFIINLVFLFRKTDFCHPHVAIFIIAFVLILIWLASNFTGKCQEYDEVYKKVSGMYGEKKALIADRNIPQPKKQISDALCKELIYAFKDATRLLINWAILLLTGVGYIMMRIMKFLE